MRITVSFFGFSISVVIFLLCGAVICYSNDFWYQDDTSLVYEYNRIHEVENVCKPFLSRASELNSSVVNTTKIKHELSFHNGDWEQSAYALSPLIPFDQSDAPESSLDQLKLVSFEINDVNTSHKIGNTVSVGGVLSIGTTRSNLFGPDIEHRFYMKPGLSVLTIIFEGVYVLTEENGGEQMLCLLGNSTLPSRKHVEDDFSLEREYQHQHQPRVFQDDQILLVLRYPKTFSLSSRAIRGEMTSLQEQGVLTYFDKVFISSQMSQYSEYQFMSEGQRPMTCSDHHYHQEMVEDGVNHLSSSEFCKILQAISSNEAFRFFSHKHFDRFPVDLDSLGPFVLGNEIFVVYKSFENVKLIMQHVKCEQGIVDEKTSSARVSAVFRVIPASMDRFTAASRTGVSGLTLLAEGTWDSSSGQLCMLGCLGRVGLSISECDVQISMYFSRELSITQRSIILGSVSSIENARTSFSPLLFNAIQTPFSLEFLYRWYAPNHLSYNYSKVNLADDFRRRIQSTERVMFPGNSLLRYPSFKGEGGFYSLSQIYDLTNDLFVDAELGFYSSDGTQMNVKLEVLSIGPYLASYDWLFKVQNEGVLVSSTTLVSDNGLVNVSLHLEVTEIQEKTKKKINTILFAEGLYDLNDGKMYLIGCGKNQWPMDLERGLDCRMEVEVQYPPVNTRWLRNPTVKINVASQRNRYDPHYFEPIHFKTRAIKYDVIKGEYEKDLAFRVAFEGHIRIIFLTVLLGILQSQLLYVKKNTEFSSYMSLTMLAINILGYGLPLLTGFGLVIPSIPLPIKKQDLDIYKNHILLRLLDYIGRVLAFAAMILTARIFRTVSESRKRLNAQGTLVKPLPTGGWNFILRFLLRFVLLGASILLAVYFLDNMISSPPLEANVTIKDAPFLLLMYITGLGLDLQVFFLFPQIIDNFRYKVQAKSCLRKTYYIGIAALWFIVVVYDVIREPLSDPYSARSAPRGRDLSLFALIFNSKSLILVIQVVLIHIQQNFNYLRVINSLKLSNRLCPTLTRFKFLLFKRRQE